MENDKPDRAMQDLIFKMIDIEQRLGAIHDSMIHFMGVQEVQRRVQIRWGQRLVIAVLTACGTIILMSFIW